MPELPPDWRTVFVDMVRGARSLDGSWFAGGPSLTPVEQIGVYADQYRMRLVDAVAEEVSGTVRLLGDGSEATLKRYLDAHPSTSWTLNRVATGFADWLEQDGAAPEVVDMARLDRAVQAGFEAASGEPLRPEQLIGVPQLALQPHVTLLRARFNVHEVRSAAGGPDAPPLRSGDFPLVVFRRGIKMRHWEVPLGAWGILDGIDHGLGIEGAIARAFERSWLDPEDMAAQLQAWFQDFAERNLVMVRRPV